MSEKKNTIAVNWGALADKVEKDERFTLESLSLMAGHSKEYFSEQKAQDAPIDEDTWNNVLRVALNITDKDADSYMKKPEDGAMVADLASILEDVKKIREMLEDYVTRPTEKV